MNVILGSNAYIEFQKEGDWQPFICCETVEITFDMETISVKTIGDGVWDAKRGQMLSYTITLSGLVPYDETGVTAWDLLQYLLQMVHAEYRMVFTREDNSKIETIQGQALAKSMNLNSPVDFLTASINLEGSGPPIFSADLCDAQVINATVVDAGGGKFRVTVTDTTGAPAVKYKYVFNIGGIIEFPGVPTIYQSKLSTTWLITPQQGSGIYRIRIIAVCDNGVDGIAYETSFNV